MDEPITIHPPYHVLMASVECPACRAVFHAAALAASITHDEDAAEICVLTHSSRLPDELIEAAKRVNSAFRLATTSYATYYANHCTECGAVFGDHYLLSPPNGLFQAIVATNPERLTCQRLPLDGTFVVEAGWVSGVGHAITNAAPDSD